MPEYIRKQAVLNLIDDLEFGNAIAADYDNVHEFQKLYDAVEATQAADVAPVVHARWEAHEFGPIDAYKCSNCGLITINRNIPLLRYCVQCGARMDGEEQ